MYTKWKYQQWRGTLFHYLYLYLSTSVLPAILSIDYSFGSYDWEKFLVYACSHIRKVSSNGGLASSGKSSQAGLWQAGLWQCCLEENSIHLSLPVWRRTDGLYAGLVFCPTWGHVLWRPFSALCITCCSVPCKSMEVFIHLNHISSIVYVRYVRV